MPAGVIKINPAVFDDPRSARAVAWNEALRLWMEDNGYEPRTRPTPEQQAVLADTAYADDPAAMAKTVLARIITRDTSAPNPTDEQKAEAFELLTAIEDSLAYDDPDLETIDVLKAEFADFAQDAPEETPVPPEAAEAVEEAAGGIDGEGETEGPRPETLTRSADGGGRVRTVGADEQTVVRDGKRVRTVWADERVGRDGIGKYIPSDKVDEAIEAAGRKAFSEIQKRQDLVDKDVLPWQRGTRLVDALDVRGPRVINEFGSHEWMGQKIMPGPEAKDGWMVRAADAVAGATKKTVRKAGNVVSATKRVLAGPETPKKVANAVLNPIVQPVAAMGVMTAHGGVGATASGVAAGAVDLPEIPDATDLLSDSVRIMKRDIENYRASQTPEGKARKAAEQKAYDEAKKARQSFAREVMSDLGY